MFEKNFTSLGDNITCLRIKSRCFEYSKDYRTIALRRLETTVPESWDRGTPA